MSNDQCWRLIDRACAVAGDRTRQTARIVTRRLARRPAAGIVRFGSWVRTKMREANTAKVFTAVQWVNAANGMPEVSGNSWEYARAWIVGRGRTDFEAILANADTIADVFTTYEDFCEGESVELAAHYAYAAATGSRGCPDEIYEPNVVESFPFGEPEEDSTPERLIARFPKLAEKFGSPQFDRRRNKW